MSSDASAKTTKNGQWNRAIFLWCESRWARRLASLTKTSSCPFSFSFLANAWTDQPVPREGCKTCQLSDFRAVCCHVTGLWESACWRSRRSECHLGVLHLLIWDNDATNPPNRLKEHHWQSFLITNTISIWSEKFKIKISKVIRDCIGFVSLPSVIDPENSFHSLNPLHPYISMNILRRN